MAQDADQSAQDLGSGQPPVPVPAPTSEGQTKYQCEMKFCRPESRAAQMPRRAATASPVLCGIWGRGGGGSQTTADEREMLMAGGSDDDDDDGGSSRSQKFTPGDDDDGAPPASGAGFLCCTSRTMGGSKHPGLQRRPIHRPISLVSKTTSLADSVADAMSACLENDSFGRGILTKVMLVRANTASDLAGVILDAGTVGRAAHAIKNTRPMLSAESATQKRRGGAVTYGHAASAAGHAQESREARIGGMIDMTEAPVGPQAPTQWAGACANIELAGMKLCLVGRHAGAVFPQQTAKSNDEDWRAMSTAQVKSLQLATCLAVGMAAERYLVPFAGAPPVLVPCVCLPSQGQGLPPQIIASAVLARSGWTYTICSAYVDTDVQCHKMAADILGIWLSRVCPVISVPYGSINCSFEHPATALHIIFGITVSGFDQTARIASGLAFSLVSALPNLRPSIHDFDAASGPLAPPDSTQASLSGDYDDDDDDADSVASSSASPAARQKRQTGTRCAVPKVGDVCRGRQFKCPTWVMARSACTTAITSGQNCRCDHLLFRAADISALACMCIVPHTRVMAAGVPGIGFNSAHEILAAAVKSEAVTVFTPLSDLVMRFALDSNVVESLARIHKFSPAYCPSTVTATCPQVVHGAFGSCSMAAKRGQQHDFRQNVERNDTIVAGLLTPRAHELLHIICTAGGMPPKDIAERIVRFCDCAPCALDGCPRADTAAFRPVDVITAALRSGLFEDTVLDIVATSPFSLRPAHVAECSSPKYLLALTLGGLDGFASSKTASSARSSNNLVPFAALGFVDAALDTLDPRLPTPAFSRSPLGFNVDPISNDGVMIISTCVHLATRILLYIESRLPALADAIQTAVPNIARHIAAKCHSAGPTAQATVSATFIGSIQEAEKDIRASSVPDSAPPKLRISQLFISSFTEALGLSTSSS